MQQSADIEVLACLRHHTFVGRNNEKNQIDPTRTGEHILYESFMTRNVDESNPDFVAFHFSEPEIDRYAPLLFFRQTISIDTGQRFDECCLSMIDMTGSADDDVHECVTRRMRDAVTQRLFAML